MVPGSLINTFLLILEPFSTPIINTKTYQGNIKLVNEKYNKNLEDENSVEYITLKNKVERSVSNAPLRRKVLKEIFRLKPLLLLVFGTTEPLFTCSKFDFSRTLFSHTS